MDNSPIPILDLKAQYASIRGEILAAINRVLDSQQFILGEEVVALEKELANYCQCQYAFGVSSGTDALLLSMMALGIHPGDEVITTPYSFFATSGSIVRLGAIPVYVDIEPTTFNINSSQIESKITKKTKAILPVHLAGQLADMDRIMDIAKRHGLFVIEDACQAIGADYKGKLAGSIGDVGCFSFFPSKNLGGYGDSGLVTCNDPQLADKIALLRNHGQRPKYHNILVGGNFRMDAIQAAVLRVKFKHLEDWTGLRRQHAATYNQLFSEKGLSISLEDLGVRPGIVVPSETGSGRHIYHLYMIRVMQRDQLLSYLKAQGISSEIYYPIPLHLQACFSEMGYKTGDFPKSESAASQSLSLPIYPELTDEMISRVVDTIDSYFKIHNGV
ncbi:MAG: transcriptional regulator [Anaerolineales bacterium]|nr:DegT/DnrJ/EryC1/StrS family aminotransferase [Anaerolineae bacterium]PWB50839.1 MAG: transcriptional regulator [Anaerolineales bacterium]